MITLQPPPLSLADWLTFAPAATKIVGSAATNGYSFDKCVSIGRAVNAQTVSIGSALDHCHVPGRKHHEPLPTDVCVVGAGIHNEPVCFFLFFTSSSSSFRPRLSSSSGAQGSPMPVVLLC